MKRPYRILAIVEGHGEVRAVPALLRCWFRHRRFQNFETPGQAIRAPGSGALKCAHDTAEAARSRSYGKLMKALEALTRAARARRPKLAT